MSYNELREKAIELGNKIRQLDEEYEKLTIEMQKAAVDEVLKEKLLTSVTWEISRNAYTWKKNQPWVLMANNLKKQIKDKEKYERLENLLHVDYHCRTNITFDANIRWDDGELNLYFSSFDTMKEFCREHQLILNVEGLRDIICKGEENLVKTIQSLSEVREFLQDLNKEHLIPYLMDRLHQNA